MEENESNMKIGKYYSSICNVYTIIWNIFLNTTMDGFSYNKQREINKTTARMAENY